MGYQVVNIRFDTLELNAKVVLSPEDKAQGMERLSEALMGELDEYKELALETEEDVPTRWVFNGQTLYIKPHGAGHGTRWILYCPDLHLNMSKGRLNDCVAHLRFSSHFLHSADEGEVLGKAYGFMVRLLGGEGFFFQTREVHRCIDIAGWSPTKEDADRFVTRGSLHGRPEEELAILPDMRGKGRKWREFAFSKSGHHACVIYDKTREVKISHKEWLYEVWKSNRWDEESQVIRIEFRYDRTCLREMGVEDPYEMLNQVDVMWAYSTQNWIRHTIPDNDTNQSRWDTSDLWVIIQTAGLRFLEAEPVVRVKKIEHDAKRAMAGFIGFAIGWAVRAKVSLEDIEEDGRGFLRWAYKPMKEYLTKRKQVTFTDSMRTKARKLGIVLVA